MRQRLPIRAQHCLLRPYQCLLLYRGALKPYLHRSVYRCLLLHLLTLVYVLILGEHGLIRYLLLVYDSLLCQLRILLTLFRFVLLWI